jgi:hypothetical protein
VRRRANSPPAFAQIALFRDIFTLFLHKNQKLRRGITVQAHFRTATYEII